jgi:hypothetical protein
LTFIQFHIDKLMLPKLSESKENNTRSKEVDSTKYVFII